MPVVHTRATRLRGPASPAAKGAKSPAAKSAKSPAAKSAKSPAAKAAKSPAAKQQQHQQQQGVLQTSSVGSGVNYKAFRRKGQQQQQQQPFGGTVASGAPVWQLVPIERDLQGTDTDTFLKDEQARLDRLRKADELFNANLKPKAVKASAAAQKRAVGRAR
ncbi:hypothetical protein OEZ86_005496 [Tetradesmus obliquus]|nr:hypothetical protein OEZ86_005496 [Tetradesmus obliquus]